MRFDRIDLSRFGSFTDHVLDLGEVSPAGDFHIIYGPNEAGKSTLRDACVDFLYGIPARSKYNFVHDYKVMEVGARITAAARSFEARRIKGRKDTLVGMGADPLSETALKAILGDIQRDEYEQMYSLDDVSLEAGGESILSSEGDLGALLFAAMSGLSDISDALAKAKDKADAFFRPSGRSFRLNELKSEVKRLDQEIRQADVDAAVYAKLRAEVRQAKSQWKAKKEERDATQAELRRLETLIDAHSVWQERMRVNEALALVADAPEVPEGADDEVDELIRQDAKARATEDTETQAVARAREELEAIVCDDIGLSLAAQAERLQDDDLEARYRNSKHIGRRQAELDRLEEGIATKLTSLGQAANADAAAMILPVADVGELKKLMATAGAVDANLKSAQREWDEARSDTAEARCSREALHVPSDPTELRAALVAARAAPLPTDLAKVRNAVDALRTECAQALSRLAPWDGDDTVLFELQSPDPELTKRLATEEAELSRSDRDLAAEDSRLRGQLAEHASTIDTLLGEANVISDDVALAARGDRDGAWSKHRESLDNNPLPEPAELRRSADAFSSAMVADDQLAAARLGQSAEIAQLRGALVARNVTEAKLNRVAENRRALRARQQAHAQEMDALCGSLRLPPGFKPYRLDLWLERCSQARKAVTALNAAEADSRSQEDKHEVARRALVSAMQSCGLVQDVGDLSWITLLQRCDDAVEAWTKAVQSRTSHDEALAKTERVEAKRKRELDRAQADKAAWSEAWSSCLANTWLGARTPAAVQEMLITLDALAADLKEARQLRDQIKAMADDRVAYQSEVERLAELAEEPFNEADPLSTTDRLRERARRAEEAQKRHKHAAKTLKSAEIRLAKAKQTVHQVACRFAELREAIPADNLEMLRARVRAGRKRARLHERLSELHHDLLSRMNQTSLDVCLASLTEHVGTAEALVNAKTKHDGLTRDLTDVDQQVSEHYSQWQQAERRLLTIGSDSATAKLVEQRRAVLLDIEEQAHEFMRLSTGVMLANEALRIYRETHRSSMMEAASAAFAQITRGVFKGLSAAPQDDRELLFGVRTDGSTVLAPEMSRGTRFQLYLSLRIAAHAELARHGDTLPFFADDILESFDDDRSQETFVMLHEMAKRGQVVYLTHHRHLCALAEKICGDGVRVHELPAVA